MQHTNIKPMKQWSVEEVGIWLLCIGFGKQVVECFKENKITGFYLSQESSTEEIKKLLLTNNDDLSLNDMDVEKIVNHIEMTKSISDFQDLITQLETIKYEKKLIEDKLAEKDEMIGLLEKQLEDEKLYHYQQPEGSNLEDHILSIEHRHEQERRRMEESHEREIRMAEIKIRHKREKEEAEKNKDSHHLSGRRHFKETPVNPHRYF